MTQTSGPTDKNPQTGVPVVKMVSVGGEVGCLTVIIVLVAVFGGIWLDRLLGTKPVLMLILVLLSAPAALFLTFWLAMRAVKNNNPQVTPGNKKFQGKEEEEGE